MVYDPQKHHRRSIRLKGYDYSQNGAYFLTECVQHRENRFGKIENEEMILNEAGKMVEKWWLELEHKFPNIMLDVFVVMPNHVHGIICIENDDDNNVDNNQINGNVGANLCVRPEFGIIGQTRRSAPTCAPTEPTTPPKTIGDMMQWFATMSTNEYIRGVKSGVYPPFDKRLWQRNYHEHIIRNEKSLENIREYIIQNPQKWEEDRFFNPS